MRQQHAHEGRSANTTAENQREARECFMIVALRPSCTTKRSVLGEERFVLFINLLESDINFRLFFPENCTGLV